MNAILWAVVALAGVGLLRIATAVIFNIYIPTFKVRFFLDKLEYVLVQILWVGGAATFFAALLIGMMERGGA